jgi:hypothetical protein
LLVGVDIYSLEAEINSIQYIQLVGGGAWCGNNVCIYAVTAIASGLKNLNFLKE